MGETADQSKAKAFPAGSFIALSPGMAHFAAADDDTVVQLNSTGPWTLNYINAVDGSAEEIAGLQTSSDYSVPVAASVRWELSLAASGGVGGG